MEAAEKIFEGKFDNVVEDDNDVEMLPTTSSETKKAARIAVRCTLRVSSCFLNRYFADT
jgi:hypothetical protein